MYRIIITCYFIILSSTLLAQNCLQRVYTSQLGVVEVGDNRGEVEKYLDEAEMKAGLPWCASFVYWVYRKCKPNFVINKPALAASWYQEDRVIERRGRTVSPPKAGDVIILSYGKTIYHTGFYDSGNDKFVTTVEGNITKNGIGGVWKIKRMRRTISAITRWE